MRSLWKDESADSMLPLVIAASVIVFGLMFVLLSYTFNTPIEEMNRMIDEGLVSSDTADSYSLMLNMWRASPFFMLIGLVLFCYERSKGTTELSSNTFFEYMFLMIISLVMSVYLVFGYGLALDSTVMNFEQIPFFTNIDSEWDTSGTRSLLISLMYWGCMFPGFLGSVLYMLHPILNQTEHNFLSEGDEEAEEGEFVTYYDMQQL